MHGNPVEAQLRRSAGRALCNIVQLRHERIADQRNTQVEAIMGCQIATQSRNAIRESSRICRCCSFAGLVHGGAGMRLETRPYLTLLQDRPTRKVPVETARGGGWVCGGGEQAEHDQRRRVGGALVCRLTFPLNLNSKLDNHRTRSWLLYVATLCRNTKSVNMPAHDVKGAFGGSRRALPKRPGGASWVQGWRWGSRTATSHPPGSDRGGSTPQGRGRARLVVKGSDIGGFGHCSLGSLRRLSSPLGPKG